MKQQQNNGQFSYRAVQQNAPIFNKPAVETVTFKEAEYPKFKNETTTTVLSSSASKDKTLSVVNAQPFVPKLKLPSIVSTSNENAKDMSAKKTPTEVAKVTLNPESIAFVPKPFQPTTTTAVVASPMPTPVNQQFVTPVGGFGNKQTGVALASEKTIYTDVLVHCIKMSIQEYQKKLKMFNKKVNNRKRYFDVLEPPTIQYINIYQHGNVPRLKCFQRITDSSIAFLNVKEDDDNEGGYFYGDATSYEKHLETQMKMYEKAIKSGHY